MSPQMDKPRGATVAAHGTWTRAAVCDCEKCEPIRKLERMRQRARLDREKAASWANKKRERDAARIMDRVKHA